MSCKKKTVAVCVGHSRKGDNGAVNTAGASEHQYNQKVGQLTCDLLNARGFSAVLFDAYSGNGYASAMSWVGEQCRKIKADVAVELHFNSAGPFAEGHEWLYWGRSAKGRKLAEAFDSGFRKAFPEAKARGAKARGLDDRGSLFLRLTPCPAAILEPFFGSSKKETEFYSASMPQVAEAYADALAAYFA